MVFVTVICLIVAAYFLWEAYKDKKNADAGHSMSTAHRISSAPAGRTPPANYKNTRTGAVSRPPSRPDNASHNTSSAPAGKPSTDSVPTGQPSANDANVQPANDSPVSAGAVAAVAGLAAASAGVAGEAAKAEASSTGHLTDGKLRFLDGPIGRKDDLTRINGVGPVIEEGLNNIGIFHYHQIANFTENDIRNVDTELDFPGRIEREDWVEQARKLSSISLEQSSLEDTNDPLDSVVSIDEHAPNFTNPDSVLTDADYTGVWNTDVLIEIQERLKVLNTRISDAPRMRMTRDEYTAIKSNDDGAFSRDRLLEILDRLRELD